MGRLSQSVRQNKLYVFLFIFVLGINLLSFVGRLGERAGDREGAAVREEQVPSLAERQVRLLFDEEEENARREKLKALVEKKPVLAVFLGLLNLAILFMIVLGLILDGYFFMRWRHGEQVKLSDPGLDEPRWDIADVGRVVLIFVSCGYVFAMLQAYAVQYFPIFDNGNFRMVFNTALMNVIGIGVILYFVVRKYGQKINVMGLTLRNAASNVFSAIVGYVALIPVLLVIMLATFFVVKKLKYHPPMQPIVQVFIEEKATVVLWVSTLFAAVFGPVAEEIFFRGFMYTAVRKKTGILGAMVVTAVIFSFLHTHAVGFLPIVVLGLFLAYLYEKTGSLVAPIAAHILHNVGMVFLVFLMRYLEG